MTEVVDLHSRKTLPPDQATAVPEVVQMIEEWLDLAKRGQLVAVGLVGVRPHGGTATEWAGVERGWYHPLNSGVAILAHRMFNARGQE